MMSLYPVIEIDYFAVCKERHKSGLGYLINEIAQMAVRDELSPTMFLTVEALDTKEYSAVEFYRKCDFDFSEKAKNEYNYQAMFGNLPTTRRMYFSLSQNLLSSSVATKDTSFSWWCSILLLSSPFRTRASLLRAKMLPPLCLHIQSTSWKNLT